MPRKGYKQTAEHIRKIALKKKQSARRKKKAPTNQRVVGLLANPATNTLNSALTPLCQMDFNAARAYLTRLDTAPDADLTPEERFIKRMGQGG